MTTITLPSRRSRPRPRVILDDPREGLTIVRVGRWHLEVVQVGRVTLARWWAPSGAFVEVPVASA